MKKIVAFLAIGAMLVSCSNDDNQKDEFFNLAEGNFWVYKIYSVSPGYEDGFFTNMIDTVKVVEQRVVNGEKYYRITHSNRLNGMQDDFLKVNEKGHLVNHNKLVLHPGKDKKYQYTKVSDYGYGYIDYQLGKVEDMTIENKNYMVYPYICDLTGANYSLQGEAVSSFYQKGLGFVVKRYNYSDDTRYSEDRLVYYQVK